MALHDLNMAYRFADRMQALEKPQKVFTAEQITRSHGVHGKVLTGSDGLHSIHPLARVQQGQD